MEWEKARKRAPAGAKGAAVHAGKEAQAAAAKAKTAPGSTGPRISARLLLGRLRAAAGRAKALAGRTFAGARAACRKAKAFAKKVAAKMLADGLVCFTAVFAACALAMLAWELAPWIFREGVTDIDPLPIIVFSLAFAFAAASLRYNIMKKFSGIRP